MATMVKWFVFCPLFCLSHPGILDSGGLGGGDSIVVPLVGVSGNRPSPVLDLVAGVGEDDPLLSGDSLFLSLPPQSSLLWSQWW